MNDQHRKQASAVTVGAKLVQQPLFADRYRCFVLNASDLPIYNVDLHASFDGNTYTESAGVIEPGEKLEFHVDVGTERKVLVQFLDSSGNYWMRNESGKLFPWPKRTRIQGYQAVATIWWITHRPKWIERKKRPASAESRATDNSTL
ncbi:hypothetical protein [Arthrobacter oryzae]|uniref:hypothetical protein n=1 Tax=Arthrobacter oryzae TaxID=409290 RepID=UPI0027893596|nr:hypothetical protein [Arthrobacter oryzae]MDQ0078226.1 hypothetical protein [Arthrobacter oryzae]